MEARLIHREWICQKHGKLFVRDAVAAEHEFFAFDRSSLVGWAAMQNSIREKARGVRRATPDTLLRVAGMPNIWCEWKAPGQKPTDEQSAMGARLQELGDIWFWCTTIVGYHIELDLLAVPMRPNAAFLALHHDAAVRSEIAKAEAKAGKAPTAAKPRARRATPGDIARARRAGVLV